MTLNEGDVGVQIRISVGINLTGKTCVLVVQPPGYPDPGVVEFTCTVASDGSYAQYTTVSSTDFPTAGLWMAQLLVSDATPSSFSSAPFTITVGSRLS